MKNAKALKTLSALAFTALLASCGGGGSSEATSYDDTNTGDLSFDSGGEIVYDNVELTMWSVTTGDDAQTQDTIIGEFNALYEGMINVSVEHISRYDLENMLNTTMQFDRENAPDLLFNHGSRAAEYNDRGWILPIDSYFTRSNTPFDRNDFSTSLIDAVTIDGETYGMPIDCHSAMIVMRTDILEKNGYEIPTNFNELVEICDDAAEKAANNELWIRGENSSGYGASEWRKASTAEPYCAFPIAYGDMWVHEFVGYTAAIQNGAELVDEEGMPAWYSPEAVEGLELLRGWIHPSETSANEHAMSKDYGSSYDVGESPFMTGNAIFKLQGPWVYAKDQSDFDNLLRDDGGKANITTRSLSNMFSASDSADSAKIKGEGHAIMLTSTVESLTKRCASAVFMDYMAYYSGIEWAKRGHLPAALSVSNSSLYREDPAYEEYIQYWGDPADYVVVPPTVNYSYIDTYFKSALQQSIASDFLSESVDSILKRQYDDCVAYIQLYS